MRKQIYLQMSTILQPEVTRSKKNYDERGRGMGRRGKECRCVMRREKEE